VCSYLNSLAASRARHTTVVRAKQQNLATALREESSIHKIKRCYKGDKFYQEAWWIATALGYFQNKIYPLPQPISPEHGDSLLSLLVSVLVHQLRNSCKNDIFVVIENIFHWDLDGTMIPYTIQCLLSLANWNWATRVEFLQPGNLWFPPDATVRTAFPVWQQMLLRWEKSIGIQYGLYLFRYEWLSKGSKWSWISLYCCFPFPK
jgi:hypothetical protein